MSWSPDARVLVSPASAYKEIAANPDAPGFWVMVRRPLFFVFAFGCLASIATSGAVTARLLLSVPLYWSFVPVTEIAALLIVTGTRRDRLPRSSAIDLFLTGHAAWTLWLLTLGLALSSGPANMIWPLLKAVFLPALAVVLGWSAYGDYWFFRTVFGAEHRRALRDAALVRLITWPIVFTIFALPALTPWAFVLELREALGEIL